MSEHSEFTPIGIIRSCYRERFGIPRQSGIAPSARAEIHIASGFEEAVRGIDEFSHLWVIFLFHGNPPSGGRRSPLLVRPPRLGGEKSVGVFASRSPFRPNPIGLSAVKLERLELRESGPVLHVSGGDFLDGTPVLDLKPYVPYADSIPHAQAAWASQAPAPVAVRFSEDATRVCGGYANLKKIITETLAADPRSAHSRKQNAGADFACRLYTPESGEIDVRWRVEDDGSALVLSMG